MAERCRYAYRKKGQRTIFCRQLDGKSFPYCAHIYFCPNTQRPEVNKAAPCTLRNKPPVNKEQ